mgnify:CR=1 FL=1
MRIIGHVPASNSGLVANVPTYMGSASLHLFAMGFLEVAEISTERAVENRCSIDAVIPATLSLFRHSVELFLKYLLYDLRVVDAGTPVEGHRVLDVFEQHRSQVALALECERASGFDRREWLDRFESLIRGVHEMDPDGQSIRYPSSLNMAPNHGGGYAISTKHLARCIAEAREVFGRYGERNC